MRYICLGSALTALATITSVQQVLAQTDENQITEARSNEKDKKPRAKKANEDVFTLGRITVYGGREDRGSGGQVVSESIVSSEDIHTQNRNTLDDALATTPGVSSASTGTGSRNERTVYVRGFDRFQVPLYVDGVRIYLPADNRLDYGRFLTPDLSEIQVQKGYASVLSGPGGMGGAINLVTRKPTKEFEGELRTGIDLGNTGDLSAFTTSGWVGTKQETYYLQASGSYRDSDGWFLPLNFKPADLLDVYSNKTGDKVGTVANNRPVEDGGRRDFSQVKDWRINLKAGFTPNATDEYVFSYTKQKGSKGAPYSVYEPVEGRTTGSLPTGGNYQRNWTWPVWDISSLAFNSNTAIGDESYFRSKVYYNTFDNLLSAYDTSMYTTQDRSNSFNSYYKDHSTGFSLEGGTDLIEKNTLKTALHFRRDVHNEKQDSALTGGSPFYEPWQKTIQDTWSIAAEDTFHVTDRLDLVGGISYDRMNISKAEEFNTKHTPNLYENPHSGGNAFNWQMAAIYRQSDASEFHASVSSRTRFPTLFELYSTRFGDAIANPDLKPERATNYEIGWAGRPTETLKIGGSLFYSDLTDVIQSFQIKSGPDTGKVQNQNVGDGRYYGTEVYGEWEALPELTLGASYTYLKRRLDDPQRPNLVPTGTPEHSAYLYAEWMPYENFTVMPNVALYSSRWSADRLESNFFHLKGFALANVNMNYKLNENFEFDFGVRNIFDASYQLAYGFPEPGRTFYLTSAVRF